MFKIRIDEYKEFDEKVNSVDCWYDKHTKLWVIQMLNKDGYQIGRAEYIYGKKAAQTRKNEIEKEHNI